MDSVAIPFREDLLSDFMVVLEGGTWKQVSCHPFQRGPSFGHMLIVGQYIGPRLPLPSLSERTFFRTAQGEVIIKDPPKPALPSLSERTFFRTYNRCGSVSFLRTRSCHPFQRGPSFGPFNMRSCTTVAVPLLPSLSERTFFRTKRGEELSSTSPPLLPSLSERTFFRTSYFKS